MFQSGVNALQNVTAELSLYEKSISSAKVILTGFVVVFAMLFLLILIIKLYSAIIAGAQKTADKKMRKKEKILEPLKGEAIQPPKAAYITPPTVEDGIPEEVVAVIAAAVAASTAPSAKTRIKSIKKANGGRSAWANAGVLDNTRPF